jgi:hypothetical protein
MYAHCIFCSKQLGRNQILEHFPVGRSVAFDAWKGRLWAVCPRCGRWNLAPLEERWEAVEDAERRFRDSPTRVHSQNIGLTQLPDGTRLIRVGEALPGEMAAWRYGRELLRRRRSFLRRMAGYALLADMGLLMMWDEREERHRSVLHRVEAEGFPARSELQLRASHLRGARLATSDAGQLTLAFPRSFIAGPGASGAGRHAGPPVTLAGEAARAALARGFVHLNPRGATGREVLDAVEVLGRKGPLEEQLRELSPGEGLDLQTRFWRLRAVSAGSGQRRTSGAEVLALEMALHEEAERRALEEDLTALEAAWREAEEIAAIADRLPDDPLLRLREGRPDP